MSEKSSYPVNLPKTDFPMKANSFTREVEFQKIWDEKRFTSKTLPIVTNARNSFCTMDRRI